LDDKITKVHWLNELLTGAIRYYEDCPMNVYDFIIAQKNNKKEGRTKTFQLNKLESRII